MSASLQTTDQKRTILNAIYLILQRQLHLYFIFVAIHDTIYAAQFRSCADKMKLPEIKTERLLLRGFEPRDYSEVETLAGNFNVSINTLNNPYPYESGMAKDWIDTHGENWSSKTCLTLAITTSDTKKLVGAIDIMEIMDSRAVIGYWIGEPYWNNGYCTEAARAVIQFAFSKLRIMTITAEHLSSNPASGKVMIKAGMSHIGREIKPNRGNSKVPMEIYEVQST
jgi:ribosomal-protein-alanine N-acetyltransferase